MTVIDKIDKYLSKKRTVNEQSEENDILEDILSFVNSLDDEYLDDEQLNLKEKILSANFTVIDNSSDLQEPEIDDVPVDVDDIVDDDIPIDIDEQIDMDPLENIPDEIVDLTDDDFIEENKKTKKKTAVRKKLAKK